MINYWTISTQRCLCLVSKNTLRADYTILTAGIMVYMETLYLAELGQVFCTRQILHATDYRWWRVHCLVWTFVVVAVSYVTIFVVKYTDVRLGCSPGAPTASCFRYRYLIYRTCWSRDKLKTPFHVVHMFNLKHLNGFVVQSVYFSI